MLDLISTSLPKSLEIFAEKLKRQDTGCIISFASFPDRVKIEVLRMPERVFPADWHICPNMQNHYTVLELHLVISGTLIVDLKISCRGLVRFS